MDDGASAMDASLLGQTLGGAYRVLRRIGAGGMGQVYEAEHTLLGRHFALKVLDTRQRTRNDAVTRFFAEARAASQIEHPHIVDVVNFVTDGPYMVLVMELLRGESLADRLLRGPLPLAEAVTILSQVCDAVAATHAAGILHRDLKPANVFLVQSNDGPHAKVLDYGIAKLKHATSEGGDPAHPAGVTTTGQLLGTPRYLSPEQARGSLSVDERADVYAAGVMLFEMLAGRPPFDGHNAFQLIWKHGNEPAPPLTDHAPHVPRELADVVARALAKEPDDRFMSMLGLRDAVLSASRSPAEARATDEAPPLSPPRPTTRVAWVAAAAAVSGAVVGALVLAGGAGVAPQETVAHAMPNAVSPPSLPSEAVAARARAEDPAAASEAPPPTAPSSVMLSLVVQPPHARLAAFGEAPVPVPDTLHVPSGQAVDLTFTAPGYVPEVRTVTLSQPEQLVVELVRRRGRPTRGEAASPIKRDF